MPKASLNGTSIYYEEAGTGFPLVWSHEFAGSAESWAEQVRFFSRRYRVITYNARGYPPSDVPENPEAYSQQHAVDDLYQLLRHLDIAQVYIGGLSMGGAVALFFGLEHPEIARALIVAGAGSGSAGPARFREQCEAFAAQLEAGGMADYLRGPTRTQLLRKDPRAWSEFAELFSRHSPLGSALTFRGFQARRPTILAQKDRLRSLRAPTLILVGDEDDPCLEPALFMKRHIPRAGLVTFPQSGQAINLEEPERFNQTTLDFLREVEAGGWAPRDHGTGAGFSAGREA